MRYSITIPAYKASYLRQAIDSVLAQSVEQFELVIVNDCSPEDLDSIVSSYDDPRIRYYTNPHNCGACNVVDNWNICLHHAVGDYVICMGDDDELTPDCLECYDELMERYPELDLYHGRVEVIDENSQFVDLQEARPEFESSYSMMWHTLAKSRIQYIGDFLFRRSALLAVGGFYKLPLAWGSDFISAYIAASSRGVANSSQPIFRYRTNSRSITTSDEYNLLKLDAVISEEQWYRDYVASHHPTDPMDIKYRELVQKLLRRKFTKKRIGLIAKDLSRTNPLRLLWWYTRRKRAQLTTPEMIYAAITAIQYRRARRY